MLDFTHLLNTPGVDVNYYGNPCYAGVNNWQTWVKPRGCTLVYLFAAGGGGSGGNANTTAGAGGTGGGGGGSGATQWVFTSAMNLPDVLYIQVGAGAKGVGQNGSTSYICLEANQNSYFLSAAGGSAGANGLSTGAGGAGGAGGLTYSTGMLSLRSFGNGTSLANGVAGTAGGNSTVAAGAMTVPNSLAGLNTGGGGGGAAGGTNGTGGGITYTTAPLGGDIFFNVNGGVTGVNGMNGLQLKNGWMMLGGAGGGGSTGSNAGNGGNGGPGCGGGGGGGKYTGDSTTAIGGYGGDGFAWIIAY